jgi:hypothetical protein|tara:strand:+ start:690 stop:1022 length:333 start_codon:yes stop_codon:yes gene_type:complete
MTDGLQSYTIDLNNLDKRLDEYAMSKFALDVSAMMRSLFLGGGPAGLQTLIKGTPGQVEAFFNSLRGEKNYMQSYVRHGLNDPRTLNSRWKLNTATKRFEKETGLRWPFK